VAVGANGSLPEGERVIDAEGRVLMPGVIDPHCHLGVNYPYDEDMRTETAQAARGGITTILLYIRTKEPSYIPFYEERSRVGEENSHIDFGFHFGIQREEHVHEIPEIVKKTGVRSFKLYFGYEPDNPIGIVPATDGWVYATMRTAAQTPGGVVSVHCENTGIATWLKDELKATGRQDLAAYSESRPPFCEVETVSRMIFLAELTGSPLYVVHTTAGESPVVAEAARARGVDVTIETCPHYLTRTAYDPDLDMRAKISPPLRDRNEVEGLWRAIFNGTVRSLGSDHVPFFPKEGKDLCRGSSRSHGSCRCCSRKEFTREASPFSASWSSIHMGRPGASASTRGRGRFRSAPTPTSFSSTLTPNASSSMTGRARASTRG
jgi:dihydroorotase-like cyclic amidohydrolase